MLLLAHNNLLLFFVKHIHVALNNLECMLDVFMDAGGNYCNADVYTCSDVEGCHAVIMQP